METRSAEADRKESESEEASVDVQARVFKVNARRSQADGGKVSAKMMRQLAGGTAIDSHNDKPDKGEPEEVQVWRDPTTKVTPIPT